MKKIIKLFGVLFISSLILSGCEEVPTEVIGKYYSENDSSYIELKEDGKFVWANGSDIMVSGSYYSKSKRQEKWGTVYHVITKAEDGRLKDQWNATDDLTMYTNHDNPKYNYKWMLRQRIAGAPGPFIFLREIKN